MRRLRLLRRRRYRLLAAGGALLALAAGVYWLHAPAPPPPALSAAVRSETVRVGGRERRYLLYAPARLAPSPALVVLFHGSGQTGDGMRVASGYEFDRLADEHGFVTAYPDGYEGNWNDCRRAAGYPARRHGIDDAGLFVAIADATRAAYGTDRVFAVGYSNGGQFAFRLALEHPDRVAGVAVFAAGLPTEANCDCTPSERAVPVMVVNGTADPINPFDGGEVSIFGFGRRGAVRSSRDTAGYFAGLAGHAAPTVTRLPKEGEADGTWVERVRWGAGGPNEVVLDAVHGGGHAIPQPGYRPPRVLGRACRAVNGPAEVWDFFARQPRRKAGG